MRINNSLFYLLLAMSFVIFGCSSDDGPSTSVGDASVGDVVGADVESTPDVAVEDGDTEEESGGDTDTSTEGGDPCEGVECSDDNPCTEDSCDDKGECVFAVTEGVVCSEADACKGEGICDVAGECIADGWVMCENMGPCYDQGCDPETGCYANPVEDGTGCNDEKACTEADSCLAGECIGTSTCADEDPCTEDVCDWSDCVFTPVEEGTPCEDGNPCTNTGSCTEGQCVTSVAECSDDNPCTLDTCDGVVGCVFLEGDGVNCDDGDLCTVNDVCYGGECAGGPALHCDDGNACTTDSCGEEGCVYDALNGTDCSDGNPCTETDTCVDGVCTGSSNTCPCTVASDCSDDADLCNGVPVCEGGFCVSGDAVSCADTGNPCTASVCEAATGECTVENVGGVPCDDGDLCTSADLCADGVCAGTAVSCDDGNVCSTGQCDVATGECAQSPSNGGVCDGPGECLGEGVCFGYQCVGAPDVCTPGFCCVGKPGPGCPVDEDLENCVCGIDDFCCDFSWDVDCVGVGLDSCGLECSEGLCCEAGENTPVGCEEPLCESCVCGLDSVCCDVAWDEDCLSKANDMCAYDCGCALETPPLSDVDCCEAHEGFGCEDQACQSCVCESDSYCCDVMWDGVCSACADSVECCGDQCACSQEAVDPVCCDATDSPGCVAGPECEFCVCSLSPECCDVAWDAECVLAASTECFPDCGCAGVLSQDCCEGSTEAVGCNEISCAYCVCEVDNACCTTLWDEDCAACAQGDCDALGGASGTSCADDCGCSGSSDAGCCAAGDGPGCGEPDCEECVCLVDSECCDVAWDADCALLAETACVPYCDCGETPEPAECCVPSSVPGCIEESCQACICAADSFCCDVQWDASCAGYANGAPIDGEGGQVSCANSCDCEGSGDCCAANGTPGWSVEVCSLCVCTVDDTCCSVAWDESCVATASGACFAACECDDEEPVPSGECCEEIPNAAGCTETSCTDCVCIWAPECCEPGGWNEVCGLLAVNQCGTSCGCEAPACCEGQITLGCPGNQECEDCVCELDSFCCVLGWDGKCGEIAAGSSDKGSCNSECGCGAVYVSCQEVLSCMAECEGQEDTQCLSVCSEQGGFESTAAAMAVIECSTLNGCDLLSGDAQVGCVASACADELVLCQ